MKYILKKCPFCNGVAEVKDYRTVWAVVCCNEDCHATILGERMEEPDGTEPEQLFEYFESTAVIRWNTRANKSDMVV